MLCCDFEWNSTSACSAGHKWLGWSCQPTSSSQNRPAALPVSRRPPTAAVAAAAHRCSACGPACPSPSAHSCSHCFHSISRLQQQLKHSHLCPAEQALRKLLLMYHAVVYSDGSAICSTAYLWCYLLCIMHHKILLHNHYRVVLLFAEHCLSFTVLYVRVVGLAINN